MKQFIIKYKYVLVSIFMALVCCFMYIASLPMQNVSANCIEYTETALTEETSVTGKFVKLYNDKTYHLDIGYFGTDETTWNIYIEHSANDANMYFIMDGPGSQNLLYYSCVYKTINYVLVDVDALKEEMQENLNMFQFTVVLADKWCYGELESMTYNPPTNDMAGAFVCEIGTNSDFNEEFYISKIAELNEKVEELETENNALKGITDETGLSFIQIVGIAAGVVLLICIVGGIASANKKKKG